MTPDSAPQDRARHWDERYARTGERASWHQARPNMSLALIDALGVTPSDGVIDVGGGSSRLVDELVARGFTDVTVLDVSPVALAIARRRLDDPAVVEWHVADILTWTPPRRWDVWHDRAVFHFLTDDDDRTTYLHQLARSLTPTGVFILATFAPDGPDHCSGLPVRRYGPDELGATIVAAVPTAAITAARHEIHTTPSGIAQPFTWVAGTTST